MIFLFLFSLIVSTFLRSQLEAKWSAVVDRSTGKPAIKLDSEENIIFVGGNIIIKFDPVGNIIWSKQLSGEAYYGLNELPFDHLEIDESDNIYVLHNYWNSIYGDSMMRSVFINKYSPLGDELWETEFIVEDIYNSNRGASIKLYEDKVIVAGSIGDYIGPKDGFVLCLDTSNGTEHWRKFSVEDDLNCYTWNRVVKADENIYLGGQIGNSKYCVLKCNENGETSWSVIYDTQTTSHNKIMDMVISNPNEVIVTGYGFTTVSIDSSGGISWSTVPASSVPDNPSIDKALEIFALEDGGIIITGYHAETYYDILNYDPDAYTIKLSSNGVIEWSYRHRANEDEFDRQSSNSIAQDIDGDIVIGGTDGEGLSYKLLLNKYNKDNGDLIWSFVDEDTDSPWSEITSLQISSNSEIYVAGIFWEYEDSKFMIKKYGTPLTSVNNAPGIVHEIEIYPNPSQNGFLSVSVSEISRYNVTVTNLAGKMIFNSVFSSSENSIDLSNIPSGLYIVSVNTNKGSISKRVFIE